MITIVVAYATADQQKIIRLQVPSGTSVAQAIQLSQLEKYFPNIIVSEVGIDGVKKCLTDIVQANDRVEIYRPLICNPKEARRLKADRQKTNESLLNGCD